MEWLASLRKSIDYMEEHLLTDIGAMEVADAVHISPFYFQKGFKIVTGYSIGEYLRNRRLYLAGLDVIRGGGDCREKSPYRERNSGYAEEKIIDLAYKYGYDTPESFTRAFSRFHGVSPMRLREQPHRIKVFLPLTVEISIKGGNKMDFTIEKREPMKMIGFERNFSYDTSYREIPEFWSEFCGRYCGSDAGFDQEENEIRQTIAECMVGEFGVCIDDIGDGKQFRYYIAGAYQGGKIPKGMKVFEIPASEWAKFKCIGTMPQALQTVNTRIFSEWLPGNQDFEMTFPINIEWYSGGDTADSNYESAIWIPVRRLG
ncbi:AraC family transcriptional regulator [Acetatifactor muris]|uniref:Right origin-binding protein n=1 Tax=Acetatifactor muris TaxID=879566 RepID=A0A2K4ZA88_9FIRM|nr:AraC family transcriptional regulator [Acetatifactor muris]MCI8800656.1 AraC family transcriptional regulator [Lachnospiraceae bacterium]MCR2047491.1 AraC family transcriptional regulator [Acetatifactor muris]SOY27386.1 Right origin-binding protein [Acetatifactor muris]